MQMISDVDRMAAPAMTAISTGEGAVGEALGIAMLDKSLDTAKEMQGSMAKMMERSVTPELGNSIDIRA